MNTNSQRLFSRWLDSFNNFLDRHVLPWPVRFLTFRFVILCTIALLIPLIVYADRTSLVLLVNSYLNVMSVTVSSIVLLYATISEARQKQIADLQEKRAQEDHIHVTEMHNLIMQSLQNQHQEIEELKQLVGLISGQVYTPEAPQALPDLRDLHPRGDKRFEIDEHQQRWDEQLPHNTLVATLRKDLKTARGRKNRRGAEKGR
jgi:hypothetical protein